MKPGDFEVTPTQDVQVGYFTPGKTNSEEYILDLSGIIVSCNLKLPRVTGYSQPEILGKHISIFYTPEDIESKRIDLELAAASQKGMYAYSGYKLKKQGLRFWSSTKINKLKDSFGGSVGYKVILRDLTYNPVIPSKFKHLQKEHFEILKDASVGIFKFSLDNFTIIQCNQKVLEFVENKPETALNVAELFKNTLDYARFVCMIETQEQIKGFELQLQCKGREAWLSLDCKVFHAERYAEVVLFDISSYKVLMNQYKDLKEDLNSFIYHTSHDLRSPLTSISGLINLIKLDKISAPILSYLEMIQGRVDHLDELLKDFSAISFNNSYEPVFTKIDVKTDVEQIIQNFVHHSKKINVLIEINEESSFFSDSIRVNTILRNLISNSFKFINTDIENSFLKVEILTSAKEAIFKISDNGIGIDNKYLLSIFKMFTRVTHESYDGNGLGLYIAKSMIDKLGGTIEAKSELGKGCEFTVKLPNKTRL